MSVILTRDEKRKRRVRSIKRFILFLAAILIFIPIIVMLILLNKVNQLEYQINELYQLIEEGGTTETEVQESEENTLPRPEEQNSKELEIQTLPTGEIFEGRKVYLTFDDGPSENTAAILDILKQYGVKATFFVVGKTDETSLTLYKRIVDEGHTLGMHSYSHDYGDIYSSVENYVADLNRLGDHLYQVTGIRPEYVRFPGGSSNRVSKVDMKELIEYLNKNGYIYYDWNLSSKDADYSNLSAEKITINCLSQVEDYSKEVIILFHDANDKKSTVEALPDIIKGIYELENTKILPITEETIPIQHIQLN
ncbi:MAG: polysaccharide deacetylase [Lachnospiraceae bacterium]|nr:polysaccharide deacetylase [Lachnospiraceae bacterium]MDD3660163.1 polysaccharide deacetylase [Lachnospiraceae bacterium]